MGRIIIAIVALLALAGAGYWYVFMSGQSSTGTQLLGYDQYSQGQTQQVPGDAQGGQGQTTTTNETQKAMKATLHTNKGDITIEFLGTDAPNTVANFAKLAKAGFYDGTKFHRVIAGFMIQGGDPLSKDDSMAARWGTGGPGYQFADEIHANNQNVAGTISMANAGPNTNGSQFFIISGPDGCRLPPQYSLFGQVVKGLEVVETMQSVPTGSGDRPKTDVVINSVTISVAD